MEESSEADDSFISPNAKIFRSKLIDTFSLMDKLKRMGTQKIVNFQEAKESAVNLKNEDLIAMPELEVRSKKFMTLKDHGLLTVQVRVYNKIPLKYRIAWLRNNYWWNTFVTLVIIVNSIAIGLRIGYEFYIIELAQIHPQTTTVLLTTLSIFNYFCLPVYLFDFLVKWLDDFKDFWANPWDIFDFVITCLAIIPEISHIINLISRESFTLTVSNKWHAFRIIRILKLITRIPSLRLVTVALSQSFRAGIYLSVLFIMFAFIFSIIGSCYFEDYTTAQNPNLKYQTSFSGILYTMATLFRIFTLNGWNILLSDVMVVKDPIISCAYFISWILIAAFIFRNLYIGIMVNNFQSIRKTLQKEFVEKDKLAKAELRKESFDVELLKESSSSSYLPDQEETALMDGITDQYNSRPNDLLNQNEECPVESTDKNGKNIATTNKVKSTTDDSDRDKRWDNYLRKNLEVLLRVKQKTYWPKDTLFVYFQLMEALMENLEEKRRLLELIGYLIVKTYEE